MIERSNFIKSSLFLPILLLMIGALYGQTQDDLLLKVSENGSLEQVKLLIEKGANVNYQNNLKKTALHLACSKSYNVAVVKYLLEQKANPNLRDNYGKTVLIMLASTWLIDDYTLLLLKNNADPNIVDNNGNSPLHILAGRYKSRLINEYAKLLIYYSANVNIKNKKGELAEDIAIRKKNTELAKVLQTKSLDIFFLAKYGKLQEIKDYLNKNRVDINKPDKNGLSPLSYALESKADRIEVLNFLLNKGADINFVSWKILDITILNNNEQMLKRVLKDFKKEIKYSPIEMAVRNSSITIVAILIDHAIKKNKDESWKKGLLIAACIEGKSETSKYLIEKGFNVNELDDNGNSALHYACGGAYNDLQVNSDLAKLLVRKGVNINQKGSGGNTALMLALKNNASKDLINFLIDNGADVKTVNSENQTILFNDFLYKKENFDVLKRMVGLGVNVGLESRKKKTALLFAIRNNNYQAVDFLLENGAEKPENRHVEAAIGKINEKMVTLLVSKGVKLSQLNTNLVVHSNNFSILEYVIKNGADVNFADSKTYCPLHYAAQLKDQGAIINILLQNGAKINEKTKDDKSFSPLDFAIESNQVDNVKLLIEKGANIHTENALVLSIKSKNAEIVNLLLSKGCDANKRYKYLTPIQYAATTETDTINLKIIKLLIDHGAKVLVYDWDEKTPLHYAMEKGDKEVIALLKGPYVEESQIRITSNNALMQKDLILEDIVPLDTSHHQYYSNSLYLDLLESLHFECENLGLIDFSALLMEKMSDSSVIIYNNYVPYYSYPETVRLSSQDINSRLGGGEEEIFIEDEYGELFHDNIQLEPDKRELSALVFYDKWYFDEKNFILSKSVKAYSPIRKYIRDGDDESFYIKKTGYFVFEDYKNEQEKKEIESRMQLFKKLKYEFFFENINLEYTRSDDFGTKDVHFEKNNSPFWTSYAINKFKKLILDRVLTGQSEGFDFHTGKKLSVKEILNNLGETVDTITVEDFDNNFEIIEMLVRRPFNINEIKSVIFIENWYIDSQTMRIDKKIIGVAPIRWHFTGETDEYREGNLKKDIAFVLYFDKPVGAKSQIKYISESVPLDSVALVPTRDMFNDYAHYEFVDYDLNFKDLFVKQVQKNKVKFFHPEYIDHDFAMYDNNNYKRIDKSLVMEYLGFMSDAILMEDFEGGLIETVERTNGYGTDSIATIYSNEIWKFDLEKFRFYKNIFSYAPSIKFYRNDDDRAKYRLISYILNNDRVNEFRQLPPKRMKLFKEIKYEFGYDLETMRRYDIPECEKDEPLFWSDYNNVKYKEIIWEKIINKEVDIFSFEQMKKMSADEIDKQLEKGLVEVIDVETGDLKYIPENLNIDDFKTFVFHEKWYVNPKTLQLHKQVLGVAPVFYLSHISADNKNEVNTEKRIPFYIYFNTEK